MKNIFERGDFRDFRVINLNEAQAPIMESYQFAQATTTVFISHKHDDLEDLQDVIGFLESKYKVKAYIDSCDPSMPAVTSGVTATRIKERITKCNKFILLATDGAIESKWCNWELGFGDAKKYKEHIALFPMKKRGSFDSDFKGNEYMSIYPYIVERRHGDTYSDGKPITPGYYVKFLNDEGSYNLTPLATWFNEH